LTIRAILVFAATIIATNAIAQETTNAFELNPAVMDRWLVVQKEIVARHKADLAAGKTQDEAEAQKFLEEACGKAGFASTDECGSIIGYVGILISGIDQRTRRYIDPMAAAQRRIAEIESNTKLSPAAKERMLAENRQGIEILRQVLEGPVPEAHLALMNAYFDRIIEANR
jgi:hypothetical protein